MLRAREGLDAAKKKARGDEKLGVDIVFRALAAPIRLYCRTVLPRVGAALSGHPSAYSYLPASVDTFPTPSALGATLGELGFVGVRFQILPFGISALHLGDAPA